MESIFSSLKSYIPSATRDPQEDYLTQLFAWMLANVPQMGAKFCRLLLASVSVPAFSVGEGDEVSVETQVTVAGGRVDMLLKVGQNGFVCEHKVMSGLGDRQIDRYASSFSGHAGTFYTVLITATTLQQTQPADIRLVWAHVYDFLVSERGNYEGEFGFLLDHFIKFLQQQGLGRIEPITMANILGFLPGRDLVGKLHSLLPKLAARDWLAACPGLANLNPTGQYSPQFHTSRWGRVGIDYFPQETNRWQPGLFAGVLIDEYEHAINFVDRVLGPDIVVFLEFDYYPKQKNDVEEQAMARRTTYLRHANYSTLRARLALDSGAFRFMGEVARNPWRILVLQQPLANVIRGAEGEGEQLDRLYGAFCQGINLITQDDLLAEILRS